MENKDPFAEEYARIRFLDYFQLTDLEWSRKKKEIKASRVEILYFTPEDFRKVVMSILRSQPNWESRKDKYPSMKNFQLWAELSVQVSARVPGVKNWNDKKQVIEYFFSATKGTPEQQEDLKEVLNDYCVHELQVLSLGLRQVPGVKFSPCVYCEEGYYGSVYAEERKRKKEVRKEKEGKEENKKGKDNSFHMQDPTPYLAFTDEPEVRDAYLKVQLSRCIYDAKLLEETFESMKKVRDSNPLVVVSKPSEDYWEYCIELVKLVAYCKFEVTTAIKAETPLRPTDTKQVNKERFSKLLRTYVKPQYKQALESSLALI